MVVLGSLRGKIRGDGLTGCLEVLLLWQSLCVTMAEVERRRGVKKQEAG